jgi:hypothetical protein
VSALEREFDNAMHQPSLQCFCTQLQSFFDTLTFSAGEVAKHAVIKVPSIVTVTLQFLFAVRDPAQKPGSLARCNQLQKSQLTNLLTIFD